MSIESEIAKAMAAGKLFNIEPVVAGDPVIRTMVVSTKISKLLEGPWESETWERRGNRLRADLEAFVKGDIITVSLTPYEHRNAYMGRLDRPDDEVWDIRSRDPKPGLRLFGRFALQDVFIALNWVSRRELRDVATLKWDFAILECQERWKELFPANEPIHGDNIHDYISTNVVLV